MVVTHNVQNADEGIKMNWEEVFGEGWLDSEGIVKLLESEYMNNLLHYIYQSYNKDIYTYPKLKRDIFKAFRITNFNDIRVVIFNEQPPTNVYANGVGFGLMKPCTLLPRVIEAVKECITSSYHPSVIPNEFDVSLQSWTDQGVLMLNTSLISDHTTSNKERQLMHKNFIREIVRAISDDLAQVIFVFTDDSQKEFFGKYIDENYHYIIQSEFTPNSSIFEDINEILITNKDVTEGLEVAINW